MRHLYTAVFLGISLFAILGLALGPTMQMADADRKGPLVQPHTSSVRDLHGSPQAHNDHQNLSNHDSCSLGKGTGNLHFLDLNFNAGHDDGERTICIR